MNVDVDVDVDVNVNADADEDEDEDEWRVTNLGDTSNWCSVACESIARYVYVQVARVANRVSHPVQSWAR